MADAAARVRLRLGRDVLLGDVEAASAAVTATGSELLGRSTRMEDIGYADPHFRGPDGRVYGLNEQKVPAAS